MARYKVITEHGAYLPVSDEIVRLELGADQKASKTYGVKAQVMRLYAEGEELEFSGIPGPHLEPLDEEARQRSAVYWKAHPNATLDPTRSLPLGQDPLLRPTFESATLAMLERMAAEAALGRPAAAPAAPAPDPRIDALTDALTKLTALVTALVPQPPTSRKAA